MKNHKIKASFVIPEKTKPRANKTSIHIMILLSYSWNEANNEYIFTLRILAAANAENAYANRVTHDFKSPPSPHLFQLHFSSMR